VYDPIWVTADKRHLRISQMEERHIRNCIALIRRRKGWRKEYLERLELELYIRSLPNGGR
jgi:hypothetical protein